MFNEFLNFFKYTWGKRIKPFKAFKALRALSANKEDTVQVFHIIEALKGPKNRYFKDFKKSNVGKRILKDRIHLIDILKNRDYLEKLPKDTLGYKYFQFVYDENLTADELAEASEIYPRDKNTSDEEHLFNKRLRDMHDLWHVTTGYGRDALGELSLLAFTYAQGKNRGIGAITLYGYWQVGRFSKNKMDLRKVIRQGYRLGKDATFWAFEDWEKLLELPLLEVREQLNSKKPSLYQEILRKYIALEEDTTEGQTVAV